MKPEALARAKLYFGVLGFCLTAVGIALDSRPLVWTAIAVLAVALGLRLWLNRRQAEREGREKTGNGLRGTGNREDSGEG